MADNSKSPVSNTGKHQSAMSAGIVEIDSDLKDKMSVDPGTLTVYVEENSRYTALFQTWLHRNRKRGIEFTIVHSTLDEISQQWGKGFRPTAENSDLGEERQNRDRAWDLLVKAAKYVASDIHLNGQGDYCEVQFEIHGELRHVEMMDPDEALAVARAFYQGFAKIKESHWKTMENQNGQIPDEALPPGFSLTSARVVRGPAQPLVKGGFFMTIRLQYSETSPDRSMYKLPALPYPKRPAGKFYLDTSTVTEIQLDKLDRVISVPSGGVWATGPTGGGKTTFLYELLKEKARQMPHKRQVWAEDPTEKLAEWAVQLPIISRQGQAYGEDYAEAGRVVLRMAPKTIMFGEGRGALVVLEFIRAVQTGHDGVITIHGEDPFQIVERVELLDPDLLNRRIFCDPQTTRAYIAMRLIPVLCPECKVSLTPESMNRVKPRILRDLKTWGDTNGVYLAGTKLNCGTCSGARTVGRQIVLEIVLNDDLLANDFITRGVSYARQNYRRRRKDACLSLLEQTINLVLAGKVSPDSIEDKVASMIPKDQMYSDLSDMSPVAPQGIDGFATAATATMESLGRVTSVLATMVGSMQAAQSGSAEGGGFRMPDRSVLLHNGGNHVG